MLPSQSSNLHIRVKTLLASFCSYVVQFVRSRPHQRLWSWVKGAAASVWTFAITCLCGGDHEEAKVILPATFWFALQKLFVHILPVFTTAAIFFLNLHGYFIGTTLAGRIRTDYQNYDRLGLQIAAKVYEILVIMSLATLVADEVREKLLFDNAGLPLGLVLSHMQFSDISFLISRECRAGCLAVIRSWRGIFFSALLFICAAVALLVGPSAAVLIIPSWHNDWTAGGASFWLNGELNPTYLDKSSIRNETCFDYLTDSSVLNDMDWTYASCPWAGYSYLSNHFSVPTTGGSHHIAYNYQTFVQDLSFQWADGPTSAWVLAAVRNYAVASNIAIAAFARQISGLNWVGAFYGTPILGTIRSQWQYSQVNGTTAAVQGRLPMVRTECLVADRWDWATVYNASSSTNILPFPVLEEFRGPRNRLYLLEVHSPNVSYTATQWLEPPSYPTLTSDGWNISDYPSAFLIIRNPPFYYTDITCSVQADWVPGTHVTSLVNYEITTPQSGILNTAEISHLQHWLRDKDETFYTTENKGPPPVFNAPPKWQKITLRKSWLDVLTPALSADQPGNTTMASVLQKVLSQIASDLIVTDTITIDSWIFEQVNNVVAGFVVDGLTRFGWDENYAYNLNRDTVWNSVVSSNGSVPGWNYGKGSWLDIWKSLLKGKAYLQPNPIYRAANGKNFHARITIEGFALGMNGAAHVPAMAVICVYLLLVVYHVCRVFRKDYMSYGSARWSSPIDMMVLAQVSAPPETALKNSCAGVETDATMRLPVRIRVKDDTDPGYEEVQLFVGSDVGSVVQAKTEYGDMKDAAAAAGGRTASSTWSKRFGALLAKSSQRIRDAAKRFSGG